MPQLLDAPFLLQAATGSPMQGIIAQLFPFLLIFGIFYFLLIRPQQRQRKALEEKLGAIKKGDEIVTAGGIVGKVLKIQEQIVDGQPKRSPTDRITIESGESRLVVERGRIVSVGTGA